VPVLISGGGPVGLTAFIGLARRGVPALLVERHPGTAIHPKARGINVRAMEVFRQWGIEDRVRRAGLAPEDHGYFFRGSSLAADDYERTGGGGLATEGHALSPTSWMVISQDALEPVLLEHARELGAGELRFGHELRSFVMDEDGVDAVVVERATGRDQRIRADYLIAADGAYSLVRETLGVVMEGHGPLVHNVSILFEADLSDVVADRRSAVYYVSPDRDQRPRGYPMSVGNPPLDGVMLTVNGVDRWLLVVGFDPERGESIEDFDTQRCLEVVRRAVGVADLPIQIISTMAWSPAARVAERYSVGRAHLVGDAAHEMTPSGAFGLNTGMLDAHGLCWKLAAVSQGWAGPGLLETHHDERHPVGTFTADQSYQLFAGTRPPRPFGNWGVIFGAAYESAAVIPDGTAAPQVNDPVVDHVPVARPGHRAPHVWGEAEGARVSILDMFGAGFSVVSRTAAWTQAATTVGEPLGVPIRGVLVGEGGAFVPEDAAAFDELYEIGDRGCVLVRPDGHVGWRVTDDANPEDRLELALNTILDRSGRRG
jgi:putative polyketide hydroxylase